MESPADRIALVTQSLFPQMTGLECPMPGIGVIQRMFLPVSTFQVVGVDISGQRSKSVDDVGEGWDVVVTVCDANCPIPPRSGLKLRWSFPDPALAGGDDEQRLAAFRKVRDGIEKRVRSLASRLG